MVYTRRWKMLVIHKGLGSAGLSTVVLCCVLRVNNFLSVVYLLFQPSNLCVRVIFPLSPKSF